MRPKASGRTFRARNNKLAKAELLSLYRRLLLVRGAEEKIRREYAKNEMKTPVHLGVGQEAIPVGVCHCLPAGAKSFGTYRNHALFLSVTEDTDRFFAELYGKATGAAKGKAGSMHLSAPEQGLLATSAVVGTTIPVAVGAALANDYRGSAEPVVVFFGDGAVEEGVFWESLNFACLKRLRVLFVCEDNGLAIHTPKSRRAGYRSMEEAVGGFTAHVQSGDGADLMEVIRLTREILKQMAEEPAPGFLHLTYYRFLEHVGPDEDFSAGYRPRPSAAELERMDPVTRFEKGLAGGGCRPEEMAAVRESVEEQLERSLRQAQADPFAPASELMTDLYAEEPA